MADLKSQISISADATGVESGVGKAKKSLASLGATAENAGKQGAAGLDRMGTASARTSRSIDTAVAKMQLQAKTIGQSTTEAALFELRQKGASRAQLESAAAALKSVDAFKAQEAAMEKSRATAARLGAYLATLTVGTVVGLGAAMRKALNDIDAFNDLKDATGASIENISALDRIARETGGGFQQASSILVKFNQVLKDAEPGKGAGAVLKALNLDLAELKRLDPVEALRATAKAFQGFTDDGKKGRAMQELFSKSIKEAGPLLKDLAEANGLVATTSTQSAAAVEEYNKNLSRLKANADDLARSLTAGLVPVLNRMFEDVKTFGEKASLAGLAGDVINLKKELDALQARKGSPFNFAADIDAQIAEAKRKFDAAKASFNAADIGRPKSAGGGRGFVNPAMASTLPSLEVPPDDKPKGSDPLAEAKRYLESLQKQVEKTRELTVYEQALADISQKRLGLLTPDLERSILATSKQVDAAQQAKAALEGMTTAREKAMQMQDRLDSSTLASVAQQMETNQALREEIELLGLDAMARTAVEQARLSSAIALKEEELIMLRNADASATQIAALEREIALLKERTNLLGQRGARVTEIEEREKSKEFAKDLNTDLKRAFSDAFASTKNPIKAFGESIFTTVASRLSAAVAQSMADSALKVLMGAFSGGAVNLGTVTGGDMMAAFDGGGYTGSGSRSGGVDGKGGFPAILHPRETVIDHTKGGGMGGSVTLNIINQTGMQVQGTVQQRGTGDDGSQVLDLLLTAVADTINAGSGPVTRAMENRFGLRTAMS